MKVIEFDFGKFMLHDDFVIGSINDGIHFTIEHNDILEQMVNDNYDLNKRLAYISNRINHYSVDPMIHKHNSSNERLICLAVIECPNHVLQTTFIESKFFKPERFKGFNSVDAALEWCKDWIAKV